VTDAYTQYQVRLERTLQAILSEVNNLRAQMERLSAEDQVKPWTPPGHWYLHVYGSQTLVTDEDLSVSDEISTRLGWRLVASGTEEACAAAANLMKVEVSA
jgi:hypothetical protein